MYREGEKICCAWLLGGGYDDEGRCIGRGMAHKKTPMIGPAKPLDHNSEARKCIFGNLFAIDSISSG